MLQDRKNQPLNEYLTIGDSEVLLKEIQKTLDTFDELNTPPILQIVAEAYRIGREEKDE